MFEPLGFMVLEARRFEPLAALGARVSGGDFDPHWPEDPRPCAVLVRSTPSRSPFGTPGTSRLGLQELLVIGRCYGAEDDKDPRVAARNSAYLAGIVSDCFHGRGPRFDAQGRAVLMTDGVTGGGPSQDPDLRWPYEVVVIRVLAPAQPVTA